MINGSHRLDLAAYPEQKVLCSEEKRESII